MIYRFSDCIFDTAREELCRADAVVNMEPQALKVLRYLLEHRDRVVLREELFDHCWPKINVSDASLTSCLKRVRQAIGQTRTGPALIETVHRRGYRFVADVIEVGEAASTSPPEVLPTPDVVTERRYLTVLSCTLAVADPHMLSLNPEYHYDLIETLRTCCLEIVAPYEGYVAQQADDGVLVYFGYPQAHEDDAQRAVRSGLALVETIPRGRAAQGLFAGTQLSIRVGVATGLMIVSTSSELETPHAPGVGSASILAVRLSGLASPGTVLMSKATAQLVSGYFECQALDKVVFAGTQETQRVYEVRGESPLQTRLEVESFSGLTPFVGREAEFALLQERWTYVQEGFGQVVLVQGEAGMGKSRLVQRLKEHMTSDCPLVLDHRCSPYHQHTMFYPIIDLMQRTLREPAREGRTNCVQRLEAWLAPHGLPLDEAVPLLADLLSVSLPEGRYTPLNLTPQRQRERTLEILLSSILAQAAKSPLLFVMEDVHWADPSTLEFLHLLAEHVATASILLMVTCRPEFVAPWDQRAEMTPVVLNRLTRSQTADMIMRVAAKQLPVVVLEQLVEKTDGVPLFVEELTRMVLESGQLDERETHYELNGELSQLTIPMTLHESLIARLDRLGIAKEIALWGAVLGREFGYEVLDAVVPYDEGVLRQGLAHLVEAELMFQRGLLPQAHYRFKHALIQEAAYNSLPKRRRQTMHWQTAQALALQFPEIVTSRPELLAQHFTAADLTEQAVGYWQQAGQLSVQRSAHQEAMSHFTTGLELLNTLPKTAELARQEIAIRLALGPVLRVMKGQQAPEIGLHYARAVELCQRFEDTRYLFPALWGLQRAHLLRPELQKAREAAEHLLIKAREQQDDGLLVVAQLALGSTLYYLGEPALAAAHTTDGITLYDPLLHHPLTRLYGGMDPGVSCRVHVSSALWLLGYPDQALLQSEAAVEQARELSHHFTLVQALLYAGLQHQRRGEALPVLELAETMIPLATEQGFFAHLAMGRILRGWSLCVQGHHEAGLASAQKGLQALPTIGGKLGRPTWLSLLAVVYGQIGQPTKGLQVLADALLHVTETGEKCWQAELYRLRGELLLQTPHSVQVQ